jgi:hypothetical protein
LHSLPLHCHSLQIILNPFTIFHYDELSSCTWKYQGIHQKHEEMLELLGIHRKSCCTPHD